jgi:LCP family protein required for cell wall assembly
MGKRRRRRSVFSRTPKSSTTAWSDEPTESTEATESFAATSPVTPPMPAESVQRVTTVPATATVVAPRQSRVERKRLQRQKQRRRRFSLVGVLAVLGVVVAIVAAVGVATHVVNNKSSGPQRTQSTLLLQIRGPDGSAVDSALLAHDPKTKRGVMLLVPSRVIADIPGHGDAPFGSAAAVGPPALAQETLADLVGVTVDGVVAFDELSFAKMIDRLGGITSDVDRDVLVAQPNGTSRVVVAHGAEQHLSGASAVAYATYTAGGPTGELDRLTRLEDVLNGVLAKTTTAALFTTALTNVGNVQSTMPIAQISTLMAGLAADAQADAVDYQSLDVKLVDTGGAPIYSLDRPRVQAFVQQSLRASIPSGLLSGDNTVLVKNGVGTPQLGRSTRDRLLKSGFVYVDGGNVPSFPYRNQQSVIIVFSSNQAAIDRGNRVAKALNLPSTDVRVSQLGQSVADVIVLLGRDYHK